jgi:two-component system, NarL family, sensor histidine kinase BarA
MAGLSLTQRSQVVFAVASAAAIGAVVAGPWLQAPTRALETQRAVWREVAVAWGNEPSLSGAGLRIVIGADPAAAAGDPFVQAALERFRNETDAFDFDRLTDELTPRLLYARALRDDDLNRAKAGLAVDLHAPGPGWRNEPIAGVLVLERPGGELARQVALDRVSLVLSAAAAWVAQLVVVRTLVVRGYLRAVRRLRDVAEKVRGGDLNARSTLRTGDELQQLGEAFNSMVENLEGAQERLESINRSLDLKVGELSEANVGLFESNKLKSEFLANVSHELRTPLNSILGFADLLSELARNDAAADPKRLRYIGHIQASGRGLLEMINELLDMAKIEAGRMEVAIGQVSVAEVLEGIAAIMRPLAESRGAAIEVERDADLPTLETDPGKLQQILYNFMSNAIKFSPEGGMVRLVAHATQRDGRPAIRLSVIDQGPGIPADMQQAVFEKFRQVDASHTKRHGGTGLGLAICRELAHMLGAGVGLQSAVGKGSTFWVEVPVQFAARELPPLMAGRAG